MTQDNVTERRRASLFTLVPGLWISINFDLAMVMESGYVFPAGEFGSINNMLRDFF